MAVNFPNTQPLFQAVYDHTTDRWESPGAIREHMLMADYRPQHPARPFSASRVRGALEILAEMPDDQRQIERKVVSGPVRGQARIVFRRRPAKSVTEQSIIDAGTFIKQSEPYDYHEANRIAQNVIVGHLAKVGAHGLADQARKADLS